MQPIWISLPFRYGAVFLFSGIALYSGSQTLGITPTKNAPTHYLSYSPSTAPLMTSLKRQQRQHSALTPPIVADIPSVIPPETPTIVPVFDAQIPDPLSSSTGDSISPEVSRQNFNIRVLLSQSKQVEISSDAGIIVVDGANIERDRISPNTAITSFADGSDFTVAQIIYKETLSLQPATPQGIISVNGQAYRGRLILALEDSQLNVVNEVPLEQYLYSVVSGEMPSDWSLEALKAQSIAARSYALVHLLRPTNSTYDLGSDTRYQVYSGIRSESSTSIRAVDETQGLILSYKGEIVEAMYASTDAMVKSNHAGVQSMSQTGANELALKGASAFSILNYYYPGTQVSRAVSQR